jgi:hypothetical protein
MVGVETGAAGTATAVVTEGKFPEHRAPTITHRAG